MKKKNLNTLITGARDSVKKFLKEKGTSIVTVMATMGMMFLMNPAMADGNAGGALTALMELVGKIVIGVGVVVGLMGVIHYALANGDGDGPAKRKATMEIASGIALLIVGAGLAATTSTLSGYLGS